MNATRNVNPKLHPSQSVGLRTLAFRAGFNDVAGLARFIGRHRVTVHRAWKNPKRFGPTYALIREALGL